MKKIMNVAGVLGAAFLLTACESTKDYRDGMSDADGASMAGAAESHGNTVYFEFDRSDISPEAEHVLKKQAEHYKHHANAKATIEGHCDCRGTSEYNLALSERRGTNAKKVMVAHGADGRHLEVVGYGKEHPVNSGMTEEDHAQNRRAVVVGR